MKLLISTSHTNLSWLAVVVVLIFAGLFLCPGALGDYKCDKYCFSSCRPYHRIGDSEFSDCVDANIYCDCGGRLPEYIYRGHDSKATKTSNKASRKQAQDNRTVIYFVSVVGAIFLILVCRGLGCCRGGSSVQRKSPRSVVAQPVIRCGNHAMDNNRSTHGQSQPSRTTSPRRPSSVNIHIEAFQLPEPNYDVPPVYSPPPTYNDVSVDVVEVQLSEPSPACSAPDVMTPDAPQSSNL